MILYHGSNVEVKNPRLLKQIRALDFGSGFYLTSDFEQANRWATLVSKRHKFGQPTISVFVFDEVEIEKLQIKRFVKANIRWLHFVRKCRFNVDFNNNSDIVIGPVADDQTMPVLDLFLQGHYDAKYAIKKLLPHKLKDQFAFKTEKSLEYLKWQETIIP